MAVTKALKKPVVKAKVAAKKSAPSKKAAVKTPVKAKAPAKKAATKAKVKSKRKPNVQFMVPLTPSAALAEIVGAKPLPRTEVTKKLWDYIKKNKLQDPKNKRNINADAKLKPIFKKDQVTMFEMTKLVSKHLS